MHCWSLEQPGTIAAEPVCLHSSSKLWNNGFSSSMCKEILHLGNEHSQHKVSRVRSSSCVVNSWADLQQAGKYIFLSKFQQKACGRQQVKETSGLGYWKLSHSCH
ncbi:hypothetical protein XENTR_v10021989 [Xenopus tropicalis]|nr:hypothetical protein XENTR_v10021989 [Xenopus tropicalis]